MESYRTVRTSVILIGVDDHVETYASLDDIPADLRRKVRESTAGDGAATILIADRKGRDALLRSLQKRLQARRQCDRPQSLKAPLRRPGAWLGTWGAILLTGAAGLTVWLLATYR